MSTQQCIFATHADAITQPALLHHITTALRELSGQVELGRAVYARLNTEAQAANSGLRCFTLGTPGARRSGVALNRGFLVETWAYEHNMPLVVLLHDDQHGIYLFQRVYEVDPTPYTWLMSDGPLLGGQLAHYDAVDYPQRGYSHERLRVLLDSPPDILTAADLRATTAWSNAVHIGLQRFYPKAARLTAPHLTPLDHDEVWQVFPHTGAAPRDVPADWHNLMASWPEDADWRLAGLPLRDY